MTETIYSNRPSKQPAPGQNPFARNYVRRIGLGRRLGLATATCQALPVSSQRTSMRPRSWKDRIPFPSRPEQRRCIPRPSTPCCIAVHSHAFWVLTKNSEKVPAVATTDSDGLAKHKARILHTCHSVIARQTYSRDDCTNRTRGWGAWDDPWCRSYGRCSPHTIDNRCALFEIPSAGARASPPVGRARVGGVALLPRCASPSSSARQPAPRGHSWG